MEIGRLYQYSKLNNASPEKSLLVPRSFFPQNLILFCHLSLNIFTIFGYTFQNW